MIRIATLHTDHEGMNQGLARELTDQLCLAKIDIVCCQGVERTLNGNQDPVRKLADTLQMTYSFSATGCSGGTGEKREEMKFRGLSILTGTSVWLLNSGSFTLFPQDPERKMTAQFAIIRQDCNALLVINGEFSPNSMVHLQQLRALFSHHLFQKLYSAVILCGNQNVAFPEEELRAAIALSIYELIDAQGESEHLGSLFNHKEHDGFLFTLLAKKSDPLSISTYGPPAALRQHSVLATEFEFHQITNGTNSRIFVPLSFSEQYA